MKITYSIIAPIFNEKDNLSELHCRVAEVMDSTGESWELILIDDGSSDSSTDMIRELAQKDKHIRPVIFARNFGHQVAVTAGLDYSRGDAVVIIDADLQDPPELILELNTGSGLKDVRAPMSAVQSAPIIEPTLEAVKGLL